MHIIKGSILFTPNVILMQLLVELSVLRIKFCYPLLYSNATSIYNPLPVCRYVDDDDDDSDHETVSQKAGNEVSYLKEYCDWAKTQLRWVKAIPQCI